MIVISKCASIDSLPGEAALSVGILVIGEPVARLLSGKRINRVGQKDGRGRHAGKETSMSYLLEPLTTGKLPLKNRLVMPPMATSKAEPDGRVSEALLDYYDEKSRGGAIGLVIIEHNYITKQGQNRAGQPSVADDEMIEGLSRLSGVIHRNGSKTALQINHVGDRR